MHKRADRQFLISFIHVSLLWIFFASLASAQLTRGYVSGTVIDESGGVIAGALVRITNIGTNQKRDMAANQAGIYRFPALEPGLYSLEFSAPGFRQTRIDSLRISPAEEIVQNVVLSVAGSVITIDVLENLPEVALSKATPSIELQMDQHSLEVLPVTAATRDPSLLALLAPTVSRGAGFNEISASGQRTRHNNFLVDGADNNDLSVTIAASRILPEAIEAIHVQSHAYSAEFGRSMGAQVSVLTRKGSNPFHGSLWDYYRGNWMEPLSLPNERFGLKDTPRYVHHQAGANFSGPIKKDRSFFFGLLETNRRREAPDTRNAQAAVIPTPKGFAAISGIPLVTGQSLASRQAVLNALIFLPDIYRVAVFDEKSLTAQNINGIPVEVGTIKLPLANPHDFWFGLGRFDHQLSGATSLTYRYLFDKRSQPDSAGNRQYGSLFSASREFLAQNHALSLTHALSPSWINEFRSAFVRENISFAENDPRSSTVLISGAFTIGGSSTFPQGSISNVFQWQDVSSIQIGRHSLKFGADIRRNRLFNLAAFDSKGTWTFNSLADFLNNRAFNLRQSVTDASYDARQTNQFYFFQDDFKASRNLTLNIGMRYEYSTVPFGFFGAATAEIAQAGVPRPAKADNNNFAPRFGVAYSPAPASGWLLRLLGNGQTAFRAGFGIGFDVLFYNILTNTASNYPRVLRSDISDPQTRNLFPALAPKQAVLPPLNPLASFGNTTEDIQNPTNHSWSFSLQRLLRDDFLFEMGYAGNRSYHLLRFGERNPGILTVPQVQSGIIPALQSRRLNPAWGSRFTVESSALSKYHALYLRASRRAANGLLFGASYTWSATLSDNDEVFGTPEIVLSSPQVPQDFRNYRNEWSRSVFDHPHRFAAHYSYDFPALYSSGSSSFLKYILNDWRVSGITEWQSGTPFTVRTGVDSGGSGVALGWRPDFNPGGIFQLDPSDNNLRTFRSPINGQGIFVTPLTPGGLPLHNSMPFGGNLGRNTLRGPAYFNWNLSLSKSISISEQASLQLRADWFNLLNHRNFGNPVATMNSAAFGTNTSDPGNRTMLLGLKLSF